MAIVRGRSFHMEHLEHDSSSTGTHDDLSSRSVSASSSTPPTTIESEIPPSQKPIPDVSPASIENHDRGGEEPRRRSVRERHSLTTYNLNVLSGTAKHGVRKSLGEHAFGIDGQADLPMDGKTGIGRRASLAKLGRSSTTEPTRRQSARRNTIVGTVSEIASSLGKRARNAVDSSSTLSGLRTMPPRSSRRTQSDAHEEPEEAPSRPRRTRQASSPPADIFNSPAPPLKRKMWQEHGLYAGQVRLYEPNFDRPTFRGGQQPKLLRAPMEERHYLPLPMFVGELKIRQGRDFHLPYDVLSLLPYEVKPKDGWVLKETVPKSRYIGSAVDYKVVDSQGQSFCRCTLPTGCDEDCMNRTMHFECDENNCNVGARHCQNRQFAVLSRPRRLNAFERGVEVMETKDRGFGVRAVRSYRPHEIIIEYTGDIITQEEADRRMNQEYKDHKNFYMMTLQENLIIDAGGKKGSIARFVNHSCDPNCYMDRWTVLGEERIALFAGECGVSTGDELTYDYKFCPFSADNVQTCLCGSINCRGVLGPKPNDPKPKKGPATAQNIASSSTTSQWKVFAKRKFNNNSSSPADEPSAKKRKVHTLVQKVLHKKPTKGIHASSRSGPSALKGTMAKSSLSLHLASKSSPTNRKRKAVATEDEDAACEICGGVDSPPTNLIVFCDTCSRAFHQKCHNPVITKDAIEKNKRWNCSFCPQPTRRKTAAQDDDVTTIDTHPASASEDEEDVACVVCQKRNNPANNKIVYCSGCERTFHQRCHSPAIPKSCVEDKDNDWFCFDCSNTAETTVKDEKNGTAAEKMAKAPGHNHGPTSKRSNKLSKGGPPTECEGCKESEWSDKNHIVFCDECNEAWHQACHIPVITQKYIEDEERFWFCNCCVFEEDSDPVRQASKIRQRRGIKPMHKAMLGENLRKKKKNLDVECKGCGKAEWNNKNHILKCTECSTSWHQQCHIPFITRKYLEDPDHPWWFCFDCVFLESDNPEWAAYKIRQRRGIKPMHKKVLRTPGATPNATPAKTAAPATPVAPQSEPTGLGGRVKSLLSNLVGPKASQSTADSAPSTVASSSSESKPAITRRRSANVATDPPRRRRSVPRRTSTMTSRSQTASAARLMGNKPSLGGSVGRLKQTALPFKSMGYFKLGGR